MQYPLLDLQSCYLDMQRTLGELLTITDTLYQQSDQTWETIHRLNATLCGVKAVLEDGIADDLKRDIAEEQAAWDEIEAQADASSY